MSLHKIIVKGTGKISLHERFTQLRFDQKATNSTKATKSTINGNSSYVNDYSAPSYSPPRARLVPHYPAPRAASPARYDRYAAAVPAAIRRPVSSYAVKTEMESWAPSYATTRMSRPAVRTGGVGRSQTSTLSFGGRMPSQSASIIAAAKLKKKSIHMRLGVRPAVPTWQEGRLYRSASTGSLARWGSNGNLSRWGSQGFLSRWGSNGSLNSGSGYGGYRPRWGGYNRRGGGGGGGGGWGGYWGRRRQTENAGNGFARGGRWRFGGGGGGGGRNNNNNRWGGRRGRGGGRNNNRRQQQPPPPSREELDKELDAYMAGTRGVLDREMDDYMSSKNA